MIRVIGVIIIVPLMALNIFCYGYETGHHDGYLTAIADVALGDMSPEKFFITINKGRVK